ncbi:zinc finger BED domain-containing protein RICESLEEPER 2-like [Rhizophagus clarus]|uniref:Zinc finger BED domain-containing protein RICESLEEPER 2-like n=1 Tax=Rhizophagus clarus TaxID=94130 RepID=A0A8H3QVL1_9GLOM|nr:zinc finger BED domain-containing protein RICESLEEPER 2-like [Rhizophagus clarus]
MCTTDNASNNDSLMKSLELVCQERNINFTMKNNHMRCMAHIINLAVQAALSCLKVGYLENENEILNEVDEPTEVIPKKFACQYEAANLLNKEVIADVKTRWNLMHDMVERSCELQEALNNTVMADRDLRKLELVDFEWILLEKIKEFLYIFSRAINHISHAQFPTISNFIPVYNWLMDEIKDLQANENTNEIIKTAAKYIMEKIQKYYQYTYALVYNAQYAPTLSITNVSDQNDNHSMVMAHNYLTIPATSVPVEKVFSGGTDFVTQKRCSLLAEMIRACIYLKSWWKIELKS